MEEHFDSVSDALESSPTNSSQSSEAFVQTSLRVDQQNEGDFGALIIRARGGERSAFDTLLKGARSRALAAAMKVLRNRDDAEDAVQDAFLKAWRNFFRFEGRSSFSTWIHRIVVNTSLDILRRQATRTEFASDEANAPTETHQEAMAETPERALDRVEVNQMVHSALAVLSVAHRQIVVLRELEEHSYEEIAVLSACPIGTVMSRLHHARKKLADELSVALAEDAPLLCAA